MKLVEELDIPELTSEQNEQLCMLMEEVAREYVLSQVSRKGIETLNASVEVEGTKPVTLTVDMEVGLSSSIKGVKIQKLVEEAVEVAFKSAERYLREQKCHLQK